MKGNRINAIATVAFALTSVAVTIPAPIGAQEDAESSSAPEVGVLAGITHYFAGGGQTIVGIPGGFLLGHGGQVYLSVPVGARGSIRAETSLLMVRAAGSATQLTLGGYGTMSLGGEATGPYALGGGGLLFLSGGGNSESEFFAGGGLGSRFLVGSAAVVRLEARYIRYLEDGGNIMQVFIGFGARIG